MGLELGKIIKTILLIIFYSYREISLLPIPAFWLPVEVIVNALG